MNPQESQLLQAFLDSLVQVRGISKDRDAEAQITRAVAQQPDAAYLLVQRALLQDQALEAAQARIAELERKVAAAATPAPPANSFLSGGGWGRQAASPAGSTNNRSASDVSVTGRPLAPNAAAGLAAAQPASALRAAPAARAMGGGFLPTLAATAAGVVGGAFLFQGLQHLMNSNAGSDAAAAAAAPTGDGSLVEGSFAPGADAGYASADASTPLDYADSSSDELSMDSDDYA